jgi:hypothetical protein
LGSVKHLYETTSAVFRNLPSHHVVRGSGCAAWIASGHRSSAGIFDRQNLTAWCVVPFDAKKRGPEERAEMLQRLGFKNFAYDWRPNDVPTFDTEVESLKKHGVNLVAWWFPTDAGDPSARTIAGSAYKAEELSKQGIVLVFAV